MAMPGMGMTMGMGSYGMGMGSYFGDPYGIVQPVSYVTPHLSSMYMPWYDFGALGSFMSSSLVDGTSTIMTDGKVIQTTPTKGTQVYTFGDKGTKVYEIPSATGTTTVMTSTGTGTPKTTGMQWTSGTKFGTG